MASRMQNPGFLFQPQGNEKPGDGIRYLSQLSRGNRGSGFKAKASDFKSPLEFIQRLVAPNILSPESFCDETAPSLGIGVNFR